MSRNEFGASVSHLVVFDADDIRHIVDYGGGELVREKSGGPTYETHLYERWQESKKLREDLEVLVGCFRPAGISISHFMEMEFARLLQDAKHIEEEAKAEYDAW